MLPVIFSKYVAVVLVGERVQNGSSGKSDLFEGKSKKGREEESERSSSSSPEADEIH